MGVRSPLWRLPPQLTLGAGSVAVVAPPEQAAAVTEYEYQQKVSNHNSLKKQLTGVDSKLADLIISLNDLTENQIPAAQKAVQEAQQKAEQAKSLAEATTARLEAAKNDRTSLEEKIKQTGEDYDDAKDAVAQLARESFHGSDASTLMDVVTNATTTEDFVNKMQSDAAVTRSEANAADAAATSLSTSMNRKERLTAIEDEITQLKGQADSQAASAQQAAEDAASKQSELEALRKKSGEERAQLEAQKKSLSTKEAQEAAELVSMKAEIDSWSVQNNTGSANAGTGGQQQIKPGAGSGSGSGSGSGAGSSKPGSGSGKPGSGSGNGSGSGGSQPGGSGQANGMNYTVPGNCYEGMPVCYGHRMNRQHGGRQRLPVEPVHVVCVPSPRVLLPSAHRLIHGQWAGLGEHLPQPRLSGQPHAARRRRDGVPCRPARRQQTLRPCGGRRACEQRRIRADLRVRRQPSGRGAMAHDLQCW